MTRDELIEGHDSVNHPGHYTANAIKYLWRWKRKNGAEDLKKAKWYIDRLLKEIELKNMNQKNTPPKTPGTPCTNNSHCITCLFGDTPLTEKPCVTCVHGLGTVDGLSRRDAGLPCNWRPKA